MAGHAGSCFCGAVAIRATGAPVEMGYCHCADCRAYSGAPVTAFTLWRAADVTITRGAEHLGAINRTGFTNRRWCMRCGGHLFAEHPGMGFTDVLAGVLPTLEFRPALHLNYAAAVLPMRDGLPKMRDFPAHAGGSGETMPE